MSQLSGCFMNRGQYWVIVSRFGFNFQTSFRYLLSSFCYLLDSFILWVGFCSLFILLCLWCKVKNSSRALIGLGYPSWSGSQLESWQKVPKICWYNLFIKCLFLKFHIISNMIFLDLWTFLCFNCHWIVIFGLWMLLCFNCWS